MFERYTPAARLAVAEASRVARRMHSQVVMLEHLAWGTLRECTAAAASDSLEPSAAPTLIARILRVLFPGDTRYHPDIVVAFQVALSEAAARGHDEVTSEHLLLAVLQQVASKGGISFLPAAGRADFEALRQDVVNVLEASTSEAKEAARVEMCARVRRLKVK